MIRVCCRRCRRAPHGVGERCTSTPHAPHESAQRGHADAAQSGRTLHTCTTRPARKRAAWECTARARTTARSCTARARTAGARNAANMGSASAHNASMHSKRMHSRYTQHEHGRRKRDNASMHASTKHGPEHPRDVDDVDERMPHNLGERCTSAPHAQHEGAQHGNAQQGHAQHRVRTARVRAAGTRNASALLWDVVTSVRGTTCVSHPSQDAAAALRDPPSAHAADRQAHSVEPLPARMHTRPRAAVGRRGPATPTVFVLAGHKGAPEMPPHPGWPATKVHPRCRRYRPGASVAQRVVSARSSTSIGPASESRAPKLLHCELGLLLHHAGKRRGPGPFRPGPGANPLPKLREKL